MTELSGADPFVRSDPAYLQAQYASPTNLAARANLHRRYRTSTVNWFDWLLGLLDWPAGADVLEVGCGPGWLWTESGPGRPRGLLLTLVDLSPGMIRVASDAVREVPGISVAGGREADVEQLPFDDASFDVVVANHMLYHAADPERAVAEIARVLRPGGCLLAATNGPANLEQLFAIRAEVFGGSGGDPAAARFGSVSGRPVLERHFAAVAWHSYDDQLRCTDADDVVAYLRSTPPGADASPEQVERLRAVVARRLAIGLGTFTVTKDTGAFVAAAPAR